MKQVWLIATVAALALAPSAHARVVQAEAILPPGQSGFVSTPGVLSGTGSPHLYDQNQEFIDFKRKPFGFDQPGDATTPKAGVTITRDAHGVPAVKGDTAYDVWWGAGYAVAQDRLFQLEAFRHATTGRLAEILGPDYLEDDLVARRDYYTAAERAAMFEAYPADLKLRFEGYRDGVNAHIAEVRMNPSELPGEFAAVGALPIPDWTIDDSLAVGVFLARTVPSGDGSELDNLRAVQERGSGDVLRDLLPIRLKGQVSTIPRKDGLFTQGRPVSAKAERRAFARSLEFVKKLPKATPEAVNAPARKRAIAPGMIGQAGGSYMFAVRGKGGKAWLFNGPQLGYSVPELFVELELHGPGTDVRGVTAPGVPVIGIGHNGKVAWGFTSGLSDEDDLYAEELVEGEPEKYRFKGETRQMECRDEVFRYRSAPTDPLGGTAPESGQKTERICRTLHGPVQLREGNVAYARRYAVWGRDLETLLGIARLNEAQSINDVDAAMQQVTWNENVIAADSQGNIGYWHPGLFQQRPSGWDQRLPLPGTGEAEWPGLVDRKTLPRSINPKQGWLANWNNIPSQGWTSGDAVATERVTGHLHRAELLMRLVRRLHRNPSFEAVRATVRRAGTTAQQRPLLKERLRAAAKRATGPAKAVLGVVVEWDGDYHRTDDRGTVHPGVAAWVELRKELMDRALAKYGEAGKRFGTGTSTSHVFDFSNGMAFAFRNASVAEVRTAAALAFEKLAERFKSEDPATWRDERRMYKVGAMGAGQAPPLPFFDRGTWEQIVELGP